MVLSAFSRHSHLHTVAANIGGSAVVAHWGLTAAGTIGGGGTIGTGVTGVTNTITVTVQLIGIGNQWAVVASVAKCIAVTVGLVGIS